MQHSNRGRTTRRRVALALSPLVATAGLTGIASPASAGVTIGSNISVFPDRDMVVAVGYQEGEELTIQVLRDGVVIGQTVGPAAATPEGVGLEVNHGPVGAPLPGDCWTNYTPDIVGGDVIRVSTARGVDTMTVADVEFVGGTYLGVDGTGATTNEVKVDITGTAAAGAAVEFRRDKPTPRFRRGPLPPRLNTATGLYTATFTPSTATSEEGLTTEQQRDIALNEASWAAVVDDITETTLAELGEPGGVGPGCTGSADPNAVAGGYQEPINITSGDIILSGTAREGVASVSITVGSLTAKEATLSTNVTGVKTWSVPFTKAELMTLPDGNITVRSTFDGLAGTNRTILKDTVAPAAPTPSPAPGTYPTAQSVTLNKPAGETLSKIHWEIGPPTTTVADPDQFSTPYTTQIAVTSSQTIKARVIDPAGNLGAVGTFAYRIGQPPAAPTLSGSRTGTTANLSWTASTGATGYLVFKGGTQIGMVAAGTRTFSDAGLAVGTYSYTVKAYTDVVSNTSVASNAVSISVPATAPGAPTVGTAVAGNAQATVNWTAPTQTGGAAITEYRIQVRTGTTIVRTVSGIASTATSHIVTGLTNGTAYNFRVRAVNSAGVGALSSPSNTVTPTAGTTVTVPGRPAAPAAASGVAGGAITATASWVPPTSTGGSAITGYVVRALRMSSTGTVLATTAFNQPATARSLQMTLTSGSYRFTVQARNSVGVSQQSPRSVLVTAR